MIVILWGFMSIIVLNYGVRKNNIWVVGRGVLRFWDARYRKPRSNLGLFSKIHANSVSGGVDII